MRFGVLGPLAVWADGGERGTGRLVNVPGTKARALPADLPAHPRVDAPARVIPVLTARVVVHDW